MKKSTVTLKTMKIMLRLGLDTIGQGVCERERETERQGRRERELSESDFTGGNHIMCELLSHLKIFCQHIHERAESKSSS